MHALPSQLRGRSLMVWRGLWGLVALFDLSILVYSYPAFIVQQGTLCTDVTRVNCGVNQLVFSQTAALDRSGISLTGYAIYAVTLDVLITLAFLLVGALIFWHKSRDRMGLFVSLLLITFGCFGIDEVHVDVVNNIPLPIEMFGILITLLQWPALGLFFYLFPDGRFVPRWSWLLTLLFVVQVGGYLFLPYPYDIPHWPPILQLLQLLVVYGSAVGTQIYRYFAVATPLQRQQIKWLAFGFATTLILSLVGIVTEIIFPDLNAPDSLSQLGGPLSLVISYAPIPLSVGIAMLRYRLWDIDVLINRALVYGLLTSVLLAIYLGLVFGSQVLLVAVIGNGNDVMLVVSTLIVAALFQPLRRRFQELIDRRFYRHRYDAARTLNAFSSSLHNEVNLVQLQERLIAVVSETMMPKRVSLWLFQTKKENVMIPDATSLVVRRDE
ncbi:MAG: hypothetical protein J2P37_26810 [Ktedonobacteraceae bacterium]|nr:hypothetical protein [Ktedonobacteraceae bacterium]